MKIIFKLLIMFSYLTWAAYSVEYLDTPWSNRFAFGFGFGVGLNFHTANFKGIDFPNIPSCCPRFETGYGLNSSLGPLLSFPLDENFSLQVQSGFEN
ncbi:MAG: hypothetical protein ACK4SO_04635, partial [Candidatus Kapaibacteriota bacterium]